MDYVKHHNINGKDYKEIPCIPGDGKPTDATVGAVGCFYMDTDTGTLYKCIAIEDGKYIWELNDVEAALKNKGVRETIYIDVNGICYKKDGTPYPISQLVSKDNYKQYQFVLVYDYEIFGGVCQAFIPLAIDNNSLGLHLSGIWFSEEEQSYFLMSFKETTAVGGGEMELTFFMTKIEGEYVTNRNGVLSIDKTALLGDIGDQTMKEYVDSILEKTSTTEPENNATIEYDYNHVMYDGEGTETATVTVQSEAEEVKLWHSGVNMLPRFTNKTLAGVTFTVDDDGIITINGTVNYSLELLSSTMLSAYFDNNGTTLPGIPFNATGTKYTLSVWADAEVPYTSGSILFRCIGSNGNMYLCEVPSDVDESDVYYITASDILYTGESIKFVDIYFNRIPNGTTFNNWKCKVQFERGNTPSTEYYPPSLTLDILPVVDGEATKEIVLDSGKNYIVTDADSIHTTITGTKIEQQIESYFGKRWACFGDSITFKYPDSTSLRYHDLVAKDLGLSVINYGVATTGYASEGNHANGQFYKRMEGIDADSFDILTIMGSCNDFGVMSRGEKELGTYTDTGTETVCGCINTTIDKFYELAPLKRLGIITMLPTLYYGDDPNAENGIPNDNLITKAPIAENYVNALIQICKNRGIPCLDLYHGSGLRPWIPEVRDAFFHWDEENQRGDGIHPNDEGVKFFAPLVREFVKSLI